MNKMNVKEYYGPGYWAAMHIDSYNANTYGEKIQVANVIVRMISTFPCKLCREHGIEYAANNPLIQAVKNNTDEMSLFRWVWKFHNTINRRLRKPELTFQQAKQMWGGKTFCIDETCE